MTREDKIDLISNREVQFMIENPSMLYEALRYGYAGFEDCSDEELDVYLEEIGERT